MPLPILIYFSIVYELFDLFIFLIPIHLIMSVILQDLQLPNEPCIMLIPNIYSLFLLSASSLSLIRTIPSLCYFYLSAS